MPTRDEHKPATAVKLFGPMVAGSPKLSPGDAPGSLPALLTRLGESARAVALSSTELAEICGEMNAGARETSAEADVLAASADAVALNIAGVAAMAVEVATGLRDANRSPPGAVTETTRDDPGADLARLLKRLARVAERTNLLVRSASIEARRAREFGRSLTAFAVAQRQMARQADRMCRKAEVIRAVVGASAQAIDRILETINRRLEMSNTLAPAGPAPTAAAGPTV